MARPKMEFPTEWVIVDSDEEPGVQEAQPEPQPEPPGETTEPGSVAPLTYG